MAQIEAVTFTAGIVLWDDGHTDRVVEAAPIVHYMKKGKWTRERVRNHCAARGWRVRVVWRMERERP